MNKIHILDNHLISLIAAGEVIERPMNVIKELLENAIDAKADKIKVELLNGGIEEIKVIDNGIGMSKEDLLLSVMPHATSKIIHEDDLFNIKTLGFRGEALPSIKSVSDFTIESNNGNSTLGYYYHYNDNELIHEGSTVLNKGTIVTVRNLFKNTPARLKYLKTPTTELNKIIDYLYKISLSHPQLKIELYNNNKLIYQSLGNNNLLELISVTYGNHTAKNMIEFANQNCLYQISGYASNNQVYKNNKYAITILINNRVVNNYNLIQSVCDAYKGILPIGKYPVVILNINCDNSLVDVNVHPSKLTVRLTDEFNLGLLITKTLKEKIDNVFSFELLEKNTSLKETDDFKYEENFNIKPSYNISWDDFQEEIETDITLNKSTSIINEPSELLNTRFKFTDLKYIGQFNKTYLLFEFDNNLYLLDQHATAERINYEKICHKFDNLLENNLPTQPLLVPYIYSFSNSELEKIFQNQSLITDLGIKFSLFTSQEIRVDEIPLWIIKGTEKETILDIFHIIINNQDVKRSEIYDKIAKMASCKKSLKANMDISLFEVNELLKNLDKCDNPFTCPHGRPSIIHFSKYDLEKRFKRVV